MRRIGVLAVVAMIGNPSFGQLMLSGNENKIDLSNGPPRMILDAEADSISVLDFSQFPPRVRTIEGIRNSVIGPPSNIAITPDEKLALVASSVIIDPTDSTQYAPDHLIHVIDLTTDPPQVIEEIQSEQQPSGMSISRDGTFALIANRAGGTVSLFRIDGKKVTLAQTVKVCEPEEQVSDVALSPDGRLAITSICEAGYMGVLEINEDGMVATDRKLSVCGKPYRVVISPDGEFALTAGSGQGKPDIDSVTVVDLKSDPIRTIDYIPTPPGPESLEISPDGKMLAVVLMDGSSFPSDHPERTENGTLAILVRQGKSFVKTQELPTGRVPEGVAFSPDGRYIVVQCHPERRLWLFEREGQAVKDTGERITVPGFPSSLRIADQRFDP